MRDLATDPKNAYDRLGRERGQAFIGLIADFRAAHFAGDVPGSPISVTKGNDSFELDWFISTGCTLRTMIVASGSADDEWKDVHRIHLVSVDVAGKEFI